MGGISASSFRLTNGLAVFRGEVSLAMPRAPPEEASTAHTPSGLRSPQPSSIPATRIFTSIFIGNGRPFGHAQFTISLQALVTASVFFVWVVRHANIVQEFKQYGLPGWLRDLAGILKMSCLLMLLLGIERKPFAVAGGTGNARLLAAAFVIHLRVKNPGFKMPPSLTSLVFSVVIA